MHGRNIGKLAGYGRGGGPRGIERERNRGGEEEEGDEEEEDERWKKGEPCTRRDVAEGEENDGGLSL